MQAEFERLENIEDDTAQLKLLLKEEKEKNAKLKSRKYIYNIETQEIKEITISDNYISKNKIIEKIEELEKIDEKNREDLYKAIQSLNFKEIDKISNKISISISIKKILKELLEE